VKFAKNCPRLVIVCGLLFFASSAQADSGASTPPITNSAVVKTPAKSNFGLFGNIGLFSAVGFTGVTGIYQPTDFLGLEVGTGYGASGIQVSFMPMLKFGSDRSFFFGTGLSKGFGTDNVGASRSGYNTTWLNVEVGRYLRTASGLGVGGAIGFTKGLAGCFSDCEPSKHSEFGFHIPSDATHYVSPEIRTFLGYWF
jgi:hypothetical protein